MIPNDFFGIVLLVFASRVAVGGGCGVSVFGVGGGAISVAEGEVVEFVVVFGDLLH
jgi:hypothetical protein